MSNSSTENNINDCDPKGPDQIAISPLESYNTWMKDFSANKFP